MNEYLFDPDVHIPRKAVAGLAHGDPNRIAALADGGAVFLTRFQQGGRDAADLAQLINEDEPASA